MTRKNHIIHLIIPALALLSVSACGVDLEVDEPATIAGDAVSTPVPASTSTPALLSSTPSLTTTLTGLSVASGQVCYVLFSEAHASDFGRSDIGPDAAAALGCIPAAMPTVTFVINALPTGRYALTVYHDIDNNGVLNQRKIFGVGVPAEPFGFSNNAPISISGAPSFSQAAFAHDGNTALTIQLKNPFG